MATQIFIEPELENLEIAENAAEWFELASELGLDRQVSLADKSAEKKAPTYMMLDPKTYRVMQVLCPNEVEYDKYGASTIPTDVLIEIKKCIDNGWYRRIVIMSDDKTPDPFVVGENTSANGWSRDRHLIARWGAELMPF